MEYGKCVINSENHILLCRAIFFSANQQTFPFLTRSLSLSFLFSSSLFRNNLITFYYSHCGFTILKFYVLDTNAEKFNLFINFVISHSNDKKKIKKKNERENFTREDIFAIWIH